MHQPDTHNRKRRVPGLGILRNVSMAALILVVLVMAVASGIVIGNRLSDSQTVRDEHSRLDEYVGLGERTGLTGDLALMVDPVTLTIEPGQEARVNLTLVNNGPRTLVLNGWLTPTPAELESNQLPIKVIVTNDGRRITYQGGGILFPPHEKKDFFRLRPGARKEFEVDLSRGSRGGWDTSAPGVYLFEVWYETYLTGRYIGVNAWTGMTNHVVAQVHVLSQGGSH